MNVLIACKYEEDPIKNRGARVFTTLCQFFRRARADNSGVGGGIWLKFELDLVDDNVFTKFGLNRSIRFQDIEQNLNSDVNQGQ